MYRDARRALLPTRPVSVHRTIRPLQSTTAASYALPVFKTYRSEMNIFSSATTLRTPLSQQSFLQRQSGSVEHVLGFVLPGLPSLLAKCSLIMPSIQILIHI